MSDERLREADVARELGVPRNTVKSWRHRGTGPKAIKLNGVVSYTRSDLEAWLAEQSQRVAS